MQIVESAVIAAAGLGSRIGLGMPKCMIEIGGVTILERLLTALRPHVSVIHLVVGYREEMVIEYCARDHRDVVLVRNQDYRTTNTAYSFAQGARHLKGKVVYLDGDLIISPVSLANFLTEAKEREILVGVTTSKSDNPVFIETSRVGKFVDVLGFTRDIPGQLEWGNIVVGPHDLMLNAEGYVFARLKEYLPLDGYVLELAEVDTSDDLKNATTFVQQLDASTG